MFPFFLVIWLMVVVEFFGQLTVVGNAPPPAVRARLQSAVRHRSMNQTRLLVNDQ